MRTSFILTAVVLLAGCQTTTAPTPVTQQAPDTSGVISAAQSVALFKAVCGGSLPNFKSAKRAMKANGITVPSPLGTTTMYSVSGNVSFKIVDGPGFGKSCSMTTSTTEPRGRINTALKALGPFKKTAIGLAAVYENTIILRGAETANGGKNYFNLRMISAR